MRPSPRDLPIYAVMLAPLLGCGAASGQPSGSPAFQARIEEVARSLQNDPRLKNLSQQQRIDRVQFVVGNTLFVLLHELGHGTRAGGRRRRYTEAPSPFVDRAGRLGTNPRMRP